MGRLSWRLILRLRGREKGIGGLLRLRQKWILRLILRLLGLLLLKLKLGTELPLVLRKRRRHGRRGARRVEDRSQQLDLVDLEPGLHPFAPRQVRTDQTARRGSAAHLIK
jgi:hypothetical protein